MYVGQTVQPVWQRVNGHRADKPWGRDIKPGRDGYTILRRVESCGNPTIDAILLDLAEAEEIQRWTPSDNANRPNPQVFRARLAQLGYNPTAPHTPTGRPWPSALGKPVDPGAIPAPVFRGATRPTPRGTPTTGPRTPQRAAPQQARVSWRAVGFLILSLTWAVIAERLCAHAVNPTTPWIVIPMGALLGPAITVGLYRKATRPRRKRRSSRRR
jgi:hypothetical protein